MKKKWLNRDQILAPNLYDPPHDPDDDLDDWEIMATS